MITNNLVDEAPGVTMYRHPPASVIFDEMMQPVDRSPYSGPPPSGEILIDWDDLEEMLVSGKFQTKVEVTEFCRNVYTLLHAEEAWSRATWRRIRSGLMPEALAALEALPQQVYRGRPESGVPQTGRRLLKKGKCSNDHKIRSVEDLASIGPDAKGRPRMGCIHCRRERSRRRRERD